ncbi:hypothetical protein JI743_14450 [Sphingopyxis sp. DHUNG17]|uniref:hypothetical protein n=1 Tax=Sphingopyxis jiangsuensis TaxID=2871171 RepID=UPI00191D6F0B|nr:hypothetical protein [Sphingopyxis lutea]MBL0770007.1 hypothetical protein [Sphingopyxis lutea]
MADRVSVTFTLGGRISVADYEELVSVIVSEGLSTEWDGPVFEASHRTEGEPLELFANEVAWGKVEALESFCADHDLAYHFWAGGFFAEWSAERIIYRGEGAPDSFIADESDRVLIDRGEIERRGSFEAVLAYFDAADFAVPPLVIEDEGDTAGKEVGRG